MELKLSQTDFYRLAVERAQLIILEAMFKYQSRMVYAAAQLQTHKNKSI